MNEKNYLMYHFVLNIFFYSSCLCFSLKKLIIVTDKEGGKNDERKGVNKDNFYFHFLHQKN